MTSRIQHRNRLPFYLRLGFLTSYFYDTSELLSTKSNIIPISYSDYIAPIRDSFGKDCLGLLYKSEIIITSQGCYKNYDDNPQKLWITSYNKTNNTNKTLPYSVIDKRVVPLIPWNENKILHIHSYNIMLLRIHCPTPFPSKLKFPSLDYVPGNFEMIRYDWFLQNKDQTGPKQDLTYQIGLSHCKDDHTNGVKEQLDICTFTPTYLECQSIWGSAMIIDTPTVSYFYGVNAPFHCEQQLNIVYKLAPLVPDLNDLIKKLQD